MSAFRVSSTQIPFYVFEGINGGRTIETVMDLPMRCHGYHTFPTKFYTLIETTLKKRLNI